MPEGTVIFYNEAKGYGFIARDDGGGGDIFVHISNCDEKIEALEKGQKVEFEEALSERTGKPEARNVKLV
jgi:CspA family cold shock protein